MCKSRNSSLFSSYSLNTLKTATFINRRRSATRAFCAPTNGKSEEGTPTETCPKAHKTLRMPNTGPFPCNLRTSANLPKAAVPSCSIPQQSNSTCSEVHRVGHASCRTVTLWAPPSMSEAVPARLEETRCYRSRWTIKGVFDPEAGYLFGCRALDRMCIIDRGQVTSSWRIHQLAVVNSLNLIEPLRWCHHCEEGKMRRVYFIITWWGEDKLREHAQEEVCEMKTHIIISRLSSTSRNQQVLRHVWSI